MTGEGTLLRVKLLLLQRERINIVASNVAEQQRRIRQIKPHPCVPGMPANSVPVETASCATHGFVAPVLHIALTENSALGRNARRVLLASE